ALGTAHQRIEPALAQPGTEEHLPARRQRQPYILIPFDAIGGERQVVKEGERLLQERRELHGGDPGRQVVHRPGSLATPAAAPRQSGSSGCAGAARRYMASRAHGGGRAPRPSWVSLGQ